MSEPYRKQDTKTSYLPPRNPVIVAGRIGSHLAKVEPDHLATRSGQPVEQVNRFGETQSARNRRSGMRAILRREPVDIETDVRLFGQAGDDPVAHGIPTFAAELRGGQRIIVEQADTRIRRRDRERPPAPEPTLRPLRSTHYT